MAEAAAAAVVAAAAEVGTAVIVGAEISWMAVAAAAAKAFIGTAIVGALTKRDEPSASFTAEAEARSTVIRSPVAPRRVIYGQVLTSGALFYVETTDSGTTATARERYPVPPNGPYTVAVAHAADFIADVDVETVTYTETFGAEGPPVITEERGDPAPYTVAAGVYTFTPAEAGRNVEIAYTYRSGGERNAYLHLLIALAGHECEEIGDVWLNEDVITTAMRDGDGNVTSGKYAGHVRLRAHLGDADQTADTFLVAESAGLWTAEHRARGVAYLYVRLLKNRTVFETGIPNIRAVVKGRQVYDPRSATTAWSDNWALCVRDYLTADFGLGCDSTDIDDTTITAAANLADESVSLAAGGTQTRYAASGTFVLSEQPLRVLEQLLGAGAGVAVWSGGAWRVKGGAYEAPTASLTASHLRGPISVRARAPRRELFNAVRGTFSDPDKQWQPTDFAPVASSTYAAQDGETIYRDLELPFTTSAPRAQRIAKIALERSRQALTVEWPATLHAFALQAWDTVSITVSTMGWSSKVFRVVDWQLAQDGLGIDLVLQEEASAVYDWSTEETTADAAPNTGLPDASTVTPPGVPSVVESLYETLGSAGLKVAARVSWAASADRFVQRYELQTQNALESAFTTQALTPDTSAVLYDLPPGTLALRVRAINQLGRASLWAAAQVEILGLTAPPAAVAGFSVRAIGGLAHLSWDLHGDLDVRLGGRIVVRHAPAVSGAVWEDGIVVEEFAGSAVGGIGWLRTGTYMAKARDSSGNYSSSMVDFVATEGMVTGFTTVATLTEDPTFTGTKTDCSVVSSELRIDGATLVDSIADWDSIADLDSLGGTRAEATYLFSADMDCTTVAVRRVEAHVAATAFDTADTIDTRTALLDTWGPIDGDQIDDCDVTLYARTTDDDPAGTPTWGSWTPFHVADFNCRAMQYKAVLTSGASHHNIGISELEVTAKIPV